MTPTASSEPKRLRNKHQAADYYNVDVRTIERMVKDGNLKAVRLRGRVLFTQEALDECIRRNEG